MNERYYTRTYYFATGSVVDSEDDIIEELVAYRDCELTREQSYKILKEFYYDHIEDISDMVSLQKLTITYDRRGFEDSNYLSMQDWIEKFPKLLSFDNDLYAKIYPKFYSLDEYSILHYMYLAEEEGFQFSEVDLSIVMECYFEEEESSGYSY